jgi:hypothetical protein
MAHAIDFEFHKFMKVTSAELAKLAEPLRQDLARMQSIDVSKLNNRELRKLRDRLLHIKWMLLVCDPATRTQIVEKMGDHRSSAPSTEESLSFDRSFIRGDLEVAMGTVKWFNATKGYGFIKPDAGAQTSSSISQLGITVSPMARRLALSLWQRATAKQLPKICVSAEYLSHDPSKYRV